MGIGVYCDGREIWSPSLKVGRLFLDEITAIERAFDLKSGVNSFLADELQIDAPVFNAFVRAVLDGLAKTNNGPLIALSTGCIQIAIALNGEISGEWPAVPHRLEHLLVGARRVMRAVESEPTA
jgi:hypothetical protein